MAKSNFGFSTEFWAYVTNNLVCFAISDVSWAPSITLLKVPSPILFLLPTSLNDISTHPIFQIRILDIILDSSLWINSPYQIITKSCHFYLLNITEIQSLLSIFTTTTLRQEPENHPRFFSFPNTLHKSSASSLHSTT